MFVEIWDFIIKPSQMRHRVSSMPMTENKDIVGRYRIDHVEVNPEACLLVL